MKSKVKLAEIPFVREALQFNFVFCEYFPIDFNLVNSF